MYNSVATMYTNIPEPSRDSITQLFTPLDLAMAEPHFRCVCISLAHVPATQRTSDVDASPTSFVASSDHKHMRVRACFLERTTTLGRAHHTTPTQPSIFRLPSPSESCVFEQLFSLRTFSAPLSNSQPDHASSCQTSPPNQPEECRTQRLPQKALSRLLKR